MLYKKPKLVNPDNSTPIFGFSGPNKEEEAKVPEIKPKKDEAFKFGTGGKSIKNHLKDNGTQDYQEDYQPHEFDELDQDEEDDGNQIKIDLNQKESQEDEEMKHASDQMPKRRGRPKKNRNIDSGDKNDFLISMNMESENNGSSSNNQNNSQSRKTNEGKNSANSGVLRKTRRQLKIAEKNQDSDNLIKVPNQVQNNQ